MNKLKELLEKGISQRDMAKVMGSQHYWSLEKGKISI